MILVYIEFIKSILISIVFNIIFQKYIRTQINLGNFEYHSFILVLTGVVREEKCKNT